MASDLKIGKWVTIALVLFLYELFDVIFYGYGIINFISFLGLHAISTAILVYCVYRAFQQKEDLCYPLLLIICSVATSVFGVAGFLLLILLRPLFSKFSTPTKKWLEELFPKDTTTLFDEVFLRIQLGWDDYSQITEVSSFLDLMMYGSLLEKQAVLDAIVKNFTPEYGPILRRGLKDPYNTVRIQAASIVSRIDMDFEDRLMDLIQEYKKDEANKESLLKLARHYEIYASLGIVDHGRKNAIIEKALYFYRCYLELDPSHQASQLSIASLLFHSDNYEEFTVWYDEFKKKYTRVPEVIHTWYLESLYREHHYEELALEVKGV